MKIITLILLTLTISLTACDPNDDIATPTNIFTVSGTDYETANCYIEFDEDNQSEFNLFFLDGRMIDNQTYPNGVTDDYLFSLNTSNFVFYNIVGFAFPQQGQTYTGGASDSTIGHGANILDLGFTSNNINFGQGQDGFGTWHLPGPVGPFITINSYSFDNNTLVGSIDVDYEFTDENGITIAGHYDGNLGVFLD